MDNSILGDLKYKYRFFFTFDYLLKKIGINFTKANIYSIKLDDIVLKASKNDNIIIKECNVDDLPLFGKLKDLFLSDMQEGHILVAAFLDDEWIGYNWVSLKPMEVEEVERIIHFKGAYTWRAHVKEEYRRMGIMREIKYFIFNLIKNKYKINEAYAITETANFPNNKALESYGYSSVGTIKYSRFFLWKKFEANIDDDSVALLND